MIESDKNKLRRRLFSKAKASAKNRNLSFSLDLDTYSKLTESPCAYCGSKGSNELTYLGMKWRWNGLDRIDNDFGYEVDNVLPCCSFCNSIRGPMKFETWVDFLWNLLLNLGSKEIEKPSWMKGVRMDKNRSTKSFYRGRRKSGRRKRKPR